MNNQRYRWGTALLVVCGLWGPKPGMGKGLTVEEAVQLAFKNSPALAVAQAEFRRAQLAVEGAEHRYVPLLTSNATYTHSEMPSFQADGAIGVGVSDTVAVGAGIHHTFSVGTAVGVDVELNGADRSVPQTSGTGAMALDGTYGVTARASVRQPLLRGLGDDVGEAELRGATLAQGVAERQQQQVSSEVVRDVVIAYWTLWVAERSEEVTRASLAVAQRRLDETQTRVDAGERAPFDVLPLETDVASLQEALTAAQATTFQTRVEMMRRMGLPVGDIVTTVEAFPTVPNSPENPETITQWVEESVAFSFEVAQQKAAVETAKNQVLVADDQAELRLDLSGWVQLDGVGAKDPTDAFGMFGRGEAVSGFVGVELELPLDRTEQKNEAARAKWLVVAAEQALLDRIRNVAAETTVQVALLTSAVERLRFAEQTEKTAKRSAAGQAARFEAGDATATDVILAEQSVREARLRVTKTKADIAIAAVKLDHLRGKLADKIKTGAVVGN